MSKQRGKIEPRGKTTRKRNPIVMFAVEGDNQTETKYLESFRRRGGPTITFAAGNATDPIGMMDDLEKSAQKHDLSPENGDRAFCLIDMDTNPKKQSQIDNALKRQNKLITLITSSPCVELWFLCHYRYSTRSLTSAEAFNELKKYCSYKKNENIYPLIADKTAVAIQHAKKLNAYHREQGHKEHTFDCNPSTDVYKVIEFLQGNEINSSHNN